MAFLFAVSPTNSGNVFRVRTRTPIFAKFSLGWDSSQLFVARLRPDIPRHGPCVVTRSANRF